LAKPEKKKKDSKETGLVFQNLINTIKNSPSKIDIDLSFNSIRNDQFQHFLGCTENRYNRLDISNQTNNDMFDKNDKPFITETSQAQIKDILF